MLFYRTYGFIPTLRLQPRHTHTYTEIREGWRHILINPDYGYSTDNTKSGPLCSPALSFSAAHSLALIPTWEKQSKPDLN